MLASPQALVFDSYGTLIDATRIAEHLDEEGVADAEGFASLWRQKQLQYTWLTGLAGRFEPFTTITRQALRYTLASRGVTLSEAQQDRLLAGWTRLPPFPETRRALGRLSLRFPLAILSNGTEKGVRAGLEYAGLGDLFRWVLTAEEVGSYKPSPRLYSLATRIVSRREQLLYVTGNPWDAAGASLAGLRVCRLLRTSEREETLAPSPEIALQDLDALAGHLDVPTAAAA